MTSRDYPEQEDELRRTRPDEEYDPYWDGKPDTPEVDAIKKLFAAVVQWSKRSTAGRLAPALYQHCRPCVVYDAAQTTVRRPRDRRSDCKRSEVFGGRSDG